MPSAFYDKLIQDLQISRKIAYKVPKNSCNTVVQELKIKAYIFLSHAAIEEYLEKIVLDVAEKAIKEFISTEKITRALVGLISSGLIGRIDEDGISKKIKREPFEDIGLFATTAFGRFKSVVSNNHGIRVTDQERLLLPIGVDPSLEDPVTMAIIDSFGLKRGNIAHEFKITKKHTLSEISGDLKTIECGLLNFDLACLRTLS